jgi:methylenetetrahydrofolate reductase (NADPH)
MGQTDWVHQENGFNHAIDLIHFIKENYGDHFCIVVAGYPEVHPDAPSPEGDVMYLKEKCDAGADVVITQLFFEVPIFNDWVKRCREAGIKAHLLPGIMPILGYEKFMKMVKFTNTKIPQYIYDRLEELKADDEEVRKFGVEVGVKMGNDLMQSGTRILHWYTMNLEKSVIEII